VLTSYSISAASTSQIGFSSGPSGSANSVATFRPSAPRRWLIWWYRQGRIVEALKSAAQEVAWKDLSPDELKAR